MQEQDLPLGKKAEKSKYQKQKAEKSKYQNVKRTKSQIDKSQNVRKLNAKVQKSLCLNKRSKSPQILTEESQVKNAKLEILIDKRNEKKLTQKNADKKRLYYIHPFTYTLNRIQNTQCKDNSFHAIWETGLALHRKDSQCGWSQSKFTRDALAFHFIVKIGNMLSISQIALWAALVMPTSEINVIMFSQSS